MTRGMTKLIIAVVAFTCTIGCSSSPPEPTGAKKKASGEMSASIKDPHAEADKIFLTRCATCHGLDGRGDGRGAANLNPKPRNYHDKAWQKSITDEQIEKTIVYGGAAVGKSPSMASNPDLADKPAIVHALCEYIRELGKEP